MNNILFYGTYTHKVDNKGRVSIPAEWRKHLTENCLYYYHISDYYNISKSYICRISIESIKDKYPKSTNDYDFRTDMLQKIMKLNLDTEGRVVFKTEKKKIATMKGCGDYFTIEFKD